MDFPIKVVTDGTGEVRVTLTDSVVFVLCAHGARVLAQALVAAADKQYCDGYRHGDDSTMFVGPIRIKPLSEIRPSDVPRGFSAEDVALPDL